MKIKLFLAATDGQDGSYTVTLFNTKQEALDDLEKTEEELNEGCFYEDGQIQEMEIEIDENGKLLNSYHFSFGD
jgi:hypothetical protein